MLKHSVKELEAVPYTTTRVIEKTGSWRVFKPILNKELCKKCMICVEFCPDIAIYELEDTVEIDYDYCKGCGICASECPYKAIKMAEER